MEFQETASPVTCITFHPSDFILAAGRNDGSVDIYDLETKSIISRADGNGHTVKCITFGLVFVYIWMISTYVFLVSFTVIKSSFTEEENDQLIIICVDLDENMCNK